MKSLLLLLLLSGCGVTQWQRDEDRVAELFAIEASLHTPEMEKAIQDAQPGVPRKK